MFLGEGKQAHDNQRRQDTSGHEVFHHGCHSTGLAHDVGDRAAKDDERHGRSRQCAARPLRIGIETYRQKSLNRSRT